MAKAIRNNEGQFYNPGRVFGGPVWGPPQFATCLDDAEAERVAASISAKAVAVPRWDGRSKSWK